MESKLEEKRAYMANLLKMQNLLKRKIQNINENVFLLEQEKKETEDYLNEITESIDVYKEHLDLLEPKFSNN